MLLDQHLPSCLFLVGQEKVDSRPILLLKSKELEEADKIWGSPTKGSKR
jgi:hypothetical protein